MKVLITGGAGFIGSSISLRCLKEGRKVVVVDDLSTGQRENLPPSVTFYEESILSPALDEIIEKEKPEIVSHHAAQIDVRKSVENPAADARINIIGTLNLLESCRRHSVQKIIFASSGGAIYGEQEVFPADEGQPTSPLSPYGIAKLTVEKYLHFYSRTYGIPFVALRYANVYGPRQNAHGEAGVVAIFTEKLLRGETPVINGDGKQTRDYVYIDDVVACNIEAMKPDVQGIFNVGTGIESDVNAIVRELIQLTHSQVSPRYGPEKPGEQLRSCLNPGALQMKKHIFLEEGLKKTVAWFQEKSRNSGAAT